MKTIMSSDARKRNLLGRGKKMAKQKITTRIRAAISKIIDSGTHLDISKTSEMIAKALGLSPRLIQYTHIEIRNMLNEQGYKATPYNERILFIAHCLRNSQKCKADYTETGLNCKSCRECHIAELKKTAEELGYKGVYITPGGSMVKKIIDKYNPKAVIGVCCYDEAQMAFENLKGKKVAPQASLLLKDGCKDTASNIEDAKEKIRLIDKEVLENHKSVIQETN
jgi:hypothetical protein